MRKVMAGILGAGAVLLLPSAAAADVTIGSNLAGTADKTICVASISCTYFQTSAGTPVAKSPIDGRVVRWRLKAGSSTGTVKLRVLRPSGSSFTAISSSNSQTVDLGVNTYTTNLAIKAGDVVALDNSTSGIYFTGSPAVPVANVLYFQPALANGSAGAPNNQQAGYELLMNADVAPNPPNPTPTPVPLPTPKISGLKLTPKAFRAAKSGASVAKKRRRPPIGATVRYRLTTDATVAFKVERAKRGRKRGGRCVSRRRGRRCTRYVRVRGGFELAGTTGTNTFKFTGRISNRKLAKGRYRLVAAPSASGKIGTAIRAKFRIK